MNGGCDHEDTNVGLHLVFLEDKQRYLAEISITCDGCGKPFGFRGLPCGMSVAGGAFVDPAATELRVVLYSPSELELAGPLPGLTEQAE
jgi:hypothetical protein